MKMSIENALIFLGLLCVCCIAWELTMERLVADIELIKKYHNEMAISFFIVVAIVVNEVRKK